MTTNFPRVPRLVAGALALLAASAALITLPSAGATQPGLNGAIIFSRGEGGNEDLFTVNADGSALRRLTGAPGNGYFASTFAAGSKLAFLDSELGVVVMNPDGSDRYTLPQARRGLFLSASPDGTRFLRSVGGTNGDAKVEMSNFDGSDPHVLLPDSGSGEWMARWSPNGERIAFIREDNEPALWVMDSNGSNERLVASVVDLPDSVGWSPDGTQLIFSADTRDSTSFPYVDTTHIFTVNVDGSDLREVPLDLPHGSSTSPRFSPDGRKIAFGFYGAAAEDRGLFIANLDGSNVQQITTGTDSEPVWLPVTAATPTTSTSTTTATPSSTTTSSTTSTTTVPNSAPKAVVSVRMNGRTLLVSGARSRDTDGTITSYRWHWGDGTPTMTTRGGTHQYATGGSYRVLLTVTDNQGVKNISEVWVHVA